jgi:predicted nucleotidyltransferase
MLKDKRLYNDDVIERFVTIISPLQNDIKEMYLFGSRSRDDWRPDSDYDILIVVDKKIEML